MSEHLIIYLDESGDLGFDFNNAKTSRFLVIALLVCYDQDANANALRSVRKTLKGKVSKNKNELKGNALSLGEAFYLQMQMQALRR